MIDHKHLKKRHVAYAAVVLAAALIALLVGGITGRRHDARPGTPAAAATGTIARYQQTLRDTPEDYRTWASLGAAYVQQARITVDPTYYPKAEGALRRSLHLNDTENHPAMVGMAALANAGTTSPAPSGGVRRPRRSAPRIRRCSAR